MSHYIMSVLWHNRRLWEAQQAQLTAVGGEDWGVYRMPQGDWGARVPGVVTDGFKTREAGVVWVADQLALRLRDAANELDEWRDIDEGDQ